jgi:hypothetical protein
MMAIWTLIAALISEVALYIQVVGALLGLLGAWSDAEGRLLGLGMLAVIPGAVLFGVAIGIFHVRTIRNRPHLQTASLIGACVLNLLVFLGSSAYDATRVFNYGP